MNSLIVSGAQPSNLKTDKHWAVYSQNNEVLKLLLNVPNIYVNIVTSALYLACLEDHEKAIFTGFSATFPYQVPSG